MKQYLDATALHQTIAQISVADDIVLPELTPQVLGRKLKGRAFERTQRHGKYLCVELSQDGWLVLHFGMTGDLKYYQNSGQVPEYELIRFEFENDYRLAYIMPRKLGEVRLVDQVQELIELKDLGPDVMASEFDLDAFLTALEGRRGMIKSTLMNQSILAGIGNVYSDEILFQAKIHPKAPVNELSDAQLEELYKQMCQVLQMAIEHQAQPEQFPAGYLIPHRQPEGECPHCGGQVERIEVSGRGGYYCPQCQQKT
jgi:formamidopyrimidine-DNA glycosylase